MVRVDEPETEESNQHELSPTWIPRGLIESLPVGLVIFDRQFRVVARNQLAESILPVREKVAESLSESTSDRSYQDWPVELRKVIDSRRSARFENVACRLGSVDPGFLNIAISPLLDDHNQRVIGGVMVLEDVTARMSMEQRLAVSERMAALGKLASRVAHELNNPLDGILRYVNLAMRVLSTSEAERAEGYLSECRHGLLRMVGIVGDLLEFSRSAHADFGAGNINSVLTEALRSYEDKISGQGVTVVCSFDEKAPSVRGDNLFQVFCNLIKNALDAMPDGGTLTVRTDLTDQHVAMTFEDTGVGLPPDHERIFEPFYTTKPRGKGTGLGLALCREVVEKYRGKIQAKPRAGGGAVLRIQIPLDSCVRMERPTPGQEPR